MSDTPLIQVIAVAASVTILLINLWTLYSIRLLVGKTLARDTRTLVQRIEEEARKTHPRRDRESP